MPSPPTRLLVYCVFVLRVEPYACLAHVYVADEGDTDAIISTGVSMRMMKYASYIDKREEHVYVGYC